MAVVNPTVRAVPNWDTLTAQQFHEFIAANVTLSNTTKQTLAALQLQLTAPEFQAFRLTLLQLSTPPANPTSAQQYQALQFYDATIKFQLEGFDLSTNDSQFILSAINSLTVPPWPAGLLQKLQRIGRPVVSWWTAEASEATPTLEQATTLLAAEKLALQKEVLEDAAVDRLQAFREALSSWDGSGEAPVL